MAGLLPFAFFIAYGVMSIPFGFLVEKFGEKRIMILAFMFAFAGSLVFAFVPVFSVFVVSLFTIGAGMAALQGQNGAETGIFRCESGDGTIW